MPTNFQLRFSDKAEQLSLLTKDDLSGLYEYPPTLMRPALTQTEFDKLTLDYAKEKQAAEDGYKAMKDSLLKDAKDSGDEATPRLVFNDTALRVDIAYGFKECMDRFSDDSKKQIRTLLKVDEKPKFQDLFLDKLATPEMKTAHDRLPGLYDGYRQAPYEDPTAPVDLAGTEEPDDALDTILTAQPGMCLDDLHSTPDGKDFLTNNMEALKKSGVKTLFIEHFWQEQQDMLDEYLQSPDGMEMPKPLARAIGLLEQQKGLDGKPVFQEMLASAKKAKVRIVGLDDYTSKTKQDNDPRQGEERAARFNRTAAEIVEREQKISGGKFLLLAGTKHNNTHVGGIPGIAQLLGVQTFDPAGGKLKVDKENTALRGMRSEPLQAFFNAFIDDYHGKLPKDNQEIVHAEAEAYARSHAAVVDRLTPDQARRLGAAASKKVIAQLKEDKAQISTLADKDKFKTSAEKTGSMLHIAADINDLDLAQALINNSTNAAADLQAVDAAGNTPLHRLMATDIKDVNAVTDLFLTNGGSLATANTAGVTPLHSALYRDFVTGQPKPMLGWIQNHPADFKKAAAVPRGNVQVLDMVMAQGEHVLEDAMYDNGMVDDVPLALQTGETKTTPELLALATRYDDLSIKPQVLAHYESLYNDFPELRSTMDLAALTTLGDRRNGRALRLFMINSDMAGGLTRKGGHGAFDDSNSTVSMGVQRDSTVLKGTLIHELSHHATNVIYNNHTMPVPNVDLGNTVEKKYLSSIESAVMGSSTALTPDDKEFQRTLTGRIDEYVQKANEKGPVRQRQRVNQEMVVGVPQLLVTHGRGMLERRGADMLDFWESELAAEIQQKIDQHPQKTKLATRDLVGKPYAPDHPWGESSKVEPKDIVEAVMDRIKIREGSTPGLYSFDVGGVAPTQASSFQLPEGFHLDKIAFKDTDDVAALQKKLRIAAGNSKRSKPGWQDVIFAEADQGANLVNPGRDDLVNRINAINQKLEVGNNKAAAFRKSRKEMENALLEKLTNTKLPDQMHAGVLSSFIDKMAIDIGGGLIDPKTLDKSLTKSTNEFGKNAKEAFSRKAEVDRREEKIAIYRHLRTRNQPMTAEEFAEAVVLEAETKYHKANPPSNGLPLEVDPKKNADLTKRIATIIRDKGNPAPEDFDKFVKFVGEQVLATKTKKKEQGHISISKRKAWVKRLSQM